MIEAGIKYYLQNKLYIWQRRKILKDEKKKSAENQIENRSAVSAKLSGNKLRDLAWSLDVLDLSKHVDGK